MNVRVFPATIYVALDYVASRVDLAFPRLLGLHDASWAALVGCLDGA